MWSDDLKAVAPNAGRGLQVVLRLRGFADLGPARGLLERALEGSGREGGELTHSLRTEP